MSQVKDFLGYVIELEDIVVYPGHKGMNKGIISGINYKTGFLIVKIKNGRYVTLKHPERVVVVVSKRYWS